MTLYAFDYNQRRGCRQLVHAGKAGAPFGDFGHVRVRPICRRGNESAVYAAHAQRATAENVTCPRCLAALATPTGEPA